MKGLAWEAVAMKIDKPAAATRREMESERLMLRFLCSDDPVPPVPSGGWYQTAPLQPSPAVGGGRRSGALVSKLAAEILTPFGIPTDGEHHDLRDPHQVQERGDGQDAQPIPPTEFAVP